MQGHSSIGRAAVSKTVGCRFKSGRACQRVEYRREPGEQGLKQFRRVYRFFRNLVAFIGDAWEELKRTHRPSRQELVAFTVVVLITVGAVAVYVGALDLLFRWLGGFIYPERTGG